MHCYSQKALLVLPLTTKTFLNRPKAIQINLSISPHRKVPELFRGYWTSSRIRSGGHSMDPVIKLEDEELKIDVKHEPLSGQEIKYEFPAGEEIKYESPAGEEIKYESPPGEEIAKDEKSAKTGPARGKRRRKEPKTAAEGLVSLEKQSKALRIAAQLDELYPDPHVPLDSKSNFQVLAATMLSARTTDKMVNRCTPALFAAAPDPAAMAALEVEKIREFIKDIGLSPTKSKNLQALSKMLIEKFSGDVPDNFTDLESLPGVGHKTASVVMIHAFGKPAFPVDTHIHRLAERWGLSSGKNVVETEADLKALYPEESWAKLHLQIIYFGREHCAAIKHDKKACLICSWADDRQESSGATNSKVKAPTSKSPLQATRKKKTPAADKPVKKSKKPRKSS